MALGPRLDLRQTQTLVMTPQLRQAIKLLQYSNIEVASFVEEELERNPLLERDDSAECRAPSAPRRTSCPSGSAKTPMQRNWHRWTHCPARRPRRSMPILARPTTPAA